MKDKVVIKRYGDAYVNFVKDSSGTQKAVEDFRNIRSLIRDNPEFLSFLLAPDITLADKTEFLENVLREGYSEDFKHFLGLLIEKKRIDKLVDIAEYIRINYSFGNEVEAVLKTATLLDLELIKQISDKLEKRIQKKVKLYIDLDDSLLGGVQVIIGNTIIDGTIRRKIDDLREKLETVRV